MVWFRAELRLRFTLCGATLVFSISQAKIGVENGTESRILVINVNFGAGKQSEKKKNVGSSMKTQSVSKVSILEPCLDLSCSP